jgi:hypothetical protein
MAMACPILRCPDGTSYPELFDLMPLPEILQNNMLEDLLREGNKYSKRAGWDTPYCCGYKTRAAYFPPIALNPVQPFASNMFI